MYVFGWLIAYVVNRAVVKDRKGKAFITLSVWTYLIFTITLFFVTFITCKYFFNKLRTNRNVVSDSETDRSMEQFSYDNDNINCVEKITWLLYTVSLTMTCVVTGGYYTAAGADLDDFDVFSLHIHGINLLIMGTDFLLSQIPIHFLHIYFPTLFVGVYVIFTGIYYAAGGTNADGKPYIYPLLDYQNDLSRAILLAIVLVTVTAIAHCIFSVVAIVRDFVATRSCSSNVANYDVSVNSENLP